MRSRASGDLAACEALLREVHACDGYPSTVDDVGAFLSPPYAVASWVVELDGGVAGHVALHAPETSRTLEVAAAVTGLPADRHVLVSRLFVDPAARGRGLAAALLRHALADARRRGLRAVLDVGCGFGPAVALYEAEGWLRLGADRQQVGDGTDGELVDVWVYLSAATPA